MPFIRFLLKFYNVLHRDSCDVSVLKVIEPFINKYRIYTLNGFYVEIQPAITSHGLSAQAIWPIISDNRDYQKTVYLSIQEYHLGNPFRVLSQVYIHTYIMDPSSSGQQCITQKKNTIF